MTAATPIQASVRRRAWLRGAVLVTLPLASAQLLLGTGASAAVPPPPAQTAGQQELELREQEAAGDLEDSSAEVRAAAAALRTIAGQLPAARADVDRARGELIGANAKADSAAAAVARAERVLAAARAQTDAAGERVDEGRDSVNRLARRAYQRGALSDLRDVVDAGSPQDVLVRAGLLQSVFRFQDDTLTRLSEDRLALARERSELAAQERALERSRRDAQREAARARTVAADAERAAARVQDLVARQSAALGAAEANRAQDLRDYRAAQAASEALAERIRAAARRAAAEAARAAAEQAARERAQDRARQAAEDRARKAAGQPRAPRRAAAPPRRAAEPPSRPVRTGQMLWPAPGRLTSRFGSRRHPIFGDIRFHAGIDIGGGLGARVSAADGGVVTYAGSASGYGTLVVISHGVVNGKDLSTAYAHMGRLSVRTGQRVGRGDKVGEIGSAGNSTGPHLHFEVRRDGSPVDPLRYVSPP